MYQKKINCKEEFNLTPQDKIANMDWCKSGCECKPMGAFAKVSVYCFASNLGARWEHLTAMGASHHSAFMDNCPTIIYICKPMVVIFVLLQVDATLVDGCAIW